MNIRSQNGVYLVNYDNVIALKCEKQDVRALTDRMAITLGEYKDEQRASEILDEIQYCLDENERIKYYNCDNLCETIYFTNYQMPKE